MFKKRSTPGSSRSASPVAQEFENDLDDISVISMGEDIPPPIMCTENENNMAGEANPTALSGDTLLNPDIHFRYTSNHPMGGILLKLLNENMKLADRINCRTTDLSAQDICTQFYNWQLSEKQRIKSKILQTTAGLEHSILTREMDSHTINESIEAPSQFSAVPTLLTPRQRADCFKLLPSGSNKFSGQKGVSILEYLNNLRAFQSQCKLSLPEFYEAMLASTTGNAYLLINSWIDNAENPSTIFHNLLVHYDTRLQPEEARAKLMAYRAPKSADLGKVEAYIMNLASRAASSIPAGPGRTANYNMEVIQGLIRSLPHASSLIVQNQNSERMAKHGRMLTAAELSRYLNIYRHTIDQDIKAHGVDSRTFERRPIQRAGNMGARKYSAYNIKGATPFPPKAQAYQITRSNNQINQVSQNYKPMAPGGNKPYIHSTTKYNYNSGNKNWSSRQGTRNFKNTKPSGFRGNKNNANFTPRRPFNNNRPSYNKDYCSLCGKHDHRASQGCPYMLSDSGVKVSVMPTKDTCPQCPTFVNPRLSHPVNLCPYRKTGPWGKQ